MPQLVTYADAKILAQIDNTNALSQYVKAAILPNAGAGNVLTELVTAVNYTYPDTIIWNADGSVSRTSTDIGSTISVATIPTLNNMEFIYVCELDRGGNISNRLSYLCNLYSSTTDNLYLKIGNYSTTTLFGRALLNNSTANFAYSGGSVKPKTVYVLHYRAALGEIDLYADGVIVSQVVGRAINPWGISIDLRLGIGSEKDKFYSATALTKTGSFTAAEINEIVTNPYQIFKVAGASFNFNGIGTISVNNSIVSTGEKSIFQPASLNVNSALTETGIKSALSSTTVNSTNTINAAGFKYSESTAQINVNTATLTAGYKSASASVSVSVVNTFTVTGTAANIIKKSGTGSITAITTINSSGVKYANGSSSISVLAAIIFAGYKTASSVLTDACFNTFSAAGFKSSSSSVSFSSNTTFTTLGYSNAFTPILRSVTINGVINNSTIPGKINNSISIKGVI